jgi:hypothetical protein
MTLAKSFISVCVWWTKFATYIFWLTDGSMKQFKRIQKKMIYLQWYIVEPEFKFYLLSIWNMSHHIEWSWCVVGVSVVVIFLFFLVDVFLFPSNINSAKLLLSFRKKPELNFPEHTFISYLYPSKQPTWQLIYIIRVNCTHHTTICMVVSLWSNKLQNM